MPASAHTPSRTVWLSIAMLCVAFLCLPPAAKGLEGKEYLRSGKASLDAGRPEEAVRDLSAAVREFPVLADYALLYLAEAYHSIGEHRKALESSRELFRKHPESPLVKKAKGNEMREAGETGENLSSIFDSYLKDFPEDGEVLFAYGFFLRQSGKGARAAEVFKNLCIKAGVKSASACVEAPPKEMKTAELMERASNLMKRYEYKEAEKELRMALAADDGSHRAEIMRSIGQSLFKQKEYRDAAAVYAKVNDTYHRAQSLYRAGDRERFDAALKDLLARHDQRASDLLLAVAADRRRDGDFSEALKIYQDVFDKYPSSSDEALWGIAWTSYRSGDYRRAADTFSRLFKKTEDPKYLYWKARSMETLGEDAGNLYLALMKTGANFYSALAHLRNSKQAQTASHPEQGGIMGNGKVSAERVEALISIGMTREAIDELSYMSRSIDSPAAAYYVISKFHELGEFRRSVGLAGKLPYSEKLHRFCYPLAYWDDVEKLSRRHEVDPLLTLSVMREESRFDADARSVTGARGLMQLMPPTAYRLAKNLKLNVTKEANLHEARTNIHLGVYYLKSLQNEFVSLSHVLAAYNAGEIVVRKWEKQSKYRSGDEFIEDIPYAETRNYVKKVLTSYFQYRKSLPPSGEEGSVLNRL
ncbi:MAG: transglycosylase SLT domain-containing protein [Nitrospiraceae bacterium]|nr:transglycosylase SLT domain-containing protein [Nitrospiraceae bacterium]